MGMFNSNLGEPFSNRFKLGDVFQLEAITVGPSITTVHGQARPVILTIDGKRYSAFGVGLLSQAEAATPDDLPAQVAMVERPTKNGQRVKLIVPAAEAAAYNSEAPF